jgi:hypothetical protein
LKTLLFAWRTTGSTLRREQGFAATGSPGGERLGDGHDEPLGKERSSFLLKSLPLYSQPRQAARVV